MAKPSVVEFWIESDGARWDHLRVRKLRGREAIGQLFSFELEAACDLEHDLPSDAKIGQEVSVVFEVDGAEVRRVHGVLSELRAHLGAADRATIDLVVVPRATRLGLVATQEIFLGQSVPDILAVKLQRQGFDATDYELRLLGKYAAREFVMQIGETDLAFMSRLVEHEGISFFFEHDDAKDRIVFTDHPAGFRALTSPAELPFHPAGETGGVFAVDRLEAIAPTSHIVQDYNYRTPLVELSACSDVPGGNGGGVVEYGGHPSTPAEAEQLALVRAEERRSRQLVYQGKTGTLTLSAGAKLTVTDVPTVSSPSTWLLVEVTHDAHAPLFGEIAPGDAHYENTFRAVPEGFTYRPPRVTPRPRVTGVVTGVVQPGPDGEVGGVAQIDADGRYIVALHLDTAELGAQKSSHPMRMAQPFAGPSYGMHFPLRRGTEVLVAFANGDPDRPLILGALYNAASPNPVVAAGASKHQLRGSTGAMFEFVTKT
ncbi:MAG TPA: type VI secretion system tip protein TssI/VgrG [Byssovorax sp.]|jgi:type VI secretion system secreted protein VgrG